MNGDIQQRILRKLKGTTTLGYITVERAVLTLGGTLRCLINELMQHIQRCQTTQTGCPLGRSSPKGTTDKLNILVITLHTTWSYYKT